LKANQIEIEPADCRFEFIERVPAISKRKPFMNIQGE
jgi:hypothetical protein